MSRRTPSFAYAEKSLPTAYEYESLDNDVNDERNPAAFSNTPLVKVNVPYFFEKLPSLKI